MIIKTETNLCNFKAWSGGKDTLDRLKELNRWDEIQYMLEDAYPDGIGATELNDFLWFDREVIAEWLGMKDLFED